MSKQEGFKKEQREAEKREKEEIKRAREMLKAVPRFNIGALFMPPIWGPAHGWWLAIVFYPLWLFADNVFYAAYIGASDNAGILALVTFVLLTAFTFAFSYFSQLHAVQRALDMGLTTNEFVKKQRFWAVLSVIIGIAFIAFATYYNLCVRTGI